MVKLKQGYIGVRFRPTLLMALADKGHVEKTIKTAFRNHEARSLSVHLLSYLLRQKIAEKCLGL